MDPSDFDGFDDLIGLDSVQDGEEAKLEVDAPLISPLSGESTAESAGLVFGPSGVSATVDRVAVEPGRSSAVKGESIAWDFRNGGMPAGIDVVGGEPEFVPQQDGSTVLRLQPLSYLKVSPESMTSLQGAGKMLNCYTLTMDIYIEKLPDHPVSLFQALADPSRPTEGECLVYEGGGVGVFGEVGVADASVRERRWSRVVVTLGTPSIRDDVPSSATAAALSRGLQLNALQSRPTPSISSARSEHPFGMSAPGSQDDDNSVDYDEEGSSLSSRHPLNIARVAGLRTGRINGSAGRSSSALATPNLPCLTTYVNSKKCSCVSASTRGVIGVKDGRFAINTQGFNLFSSSQIKYMPGLLVRFVELRPVSLSEARVKEVAFSNRIYSAWDKEQAKILAEMRANMTLQPLYKQPPPIYVHPLFVAEVADPFLEGTGMDGGSLVSSAAALSLAVDRLVRTAATAEGFEIPAINEIPSTKHLPSLTFAKLGFNHEDLQRMNFLAELLKQSKNLFHRFGMAQKNGPAQLIHFMKYFKAKLASLSEGGVLLVPGGIEAASYVYIVERPDSIRYRFTVFNADAEGGLMYHACSAGTPNKLKFQNMFCVNDVCVEKIMDDAFWSFLFKLAVFPDPKFNTPAKLYAWLIPFLVDKPTDHILSESILGHHVSFRTPPRSDTGFLRCLLDASAYVLRSRGVSNDNCTLFLFLLRVQLIEFALHDIKFVPYLRGSDRSVLRIAASQLAHAAVKIGGAKSSQRAAIATAFAESGAMDITRTDECENRSLLPLHALSDVQRMVEALLLCCETTRLIDLSENSLAAPRALRLNGNNISNIAMAGLLHPFADRLVRLEDVNGLAGAPVIQPKYVPVDFLQLPVRINTLEDAVAAIRYTDHLCTLLSVQTKTVKNTNLLKVSTIQNTFTRLVPVPKAPETTDYANCIWRIPMRYGLQLDLLICLGRITEHFISSIFALPINKSMDGVRMIVTWAIAAIADAVLRLPKLNILDQPSRFCLYLMGTIGGGLGTGFGISSSKFGSQAETIEVHHPELNITRTAILDYFDSQRRLAKIFNWNDGHTYEESLKDFLETLCTSLAFPVDEKSMIGYMVQGNTLVNKNYPEFHVYRDIIFFAKYVLNVDTRVFPPPSPFNQMSVELQWKFEQGMFMVLSFGGQFPIRAYAEAPFSDTTHRYPSFALPSHLAQPHIVRTEDDVLHIRNLPTFEDAIGQQDSELLISFLTIPYLRIPLVLSFFATEDRIHTLRSKDLQALLDSVVFEPGRYLRLSDGQDIPQHVPTNRTELLATSYGLLLNELQFSPEGFFRSVVALLKAAINLDVGTVHSTTVPIILYVLRFIARVESFVCFLIDHSTGVHETITAHLRGIMLTAEILSALIDGKDALRSIINSHVQRMIEAWLDELVRECQENGDDSIVIDTNTRMACRLHAHLILLMRNVSIQDFSVDVASTLASSFTFLSTRHTWNHNILEDLPEHEVYEVLSVQRRRLIEWTRFQSQPILDKIMESVLRVVTDTGSRQACVASVTISHKKRGTRPSGFVDSGLVWSFIAGPRSLGRFTQMSSRLLAHQLTPVVDNSNLVISPLLRRVNSEPYQRPPEISDNVELGVEIDLQAVQLTLKSAHLQALDSVIASDLDVQSIFGKASMQVTTVESTEHRLWVSLTGRNYDIQYWRTPDDRPCIQDFDRDYNPGELFESEEWIAPIFEPVRLTYMTTPFVLQVCMPDMPFSADVDVACIVGIHPKNGGVWKEILVFKKLGMVQVFNIVSHGRRFYRVLEYTTDARCTLREMQPSIENRRSPWPQWERFGVGHPYDDHWGNPLSCVITRSREHSRNLSGGLETYIPARLLYGTIPQSLLDTYQFWQDEEDFIRGYPLDDTSTGDHNEKNESDGIMANKCPHMLLIRLLSVNPVDASREKGVTAHIRRVLKQPMIERKQDMIHFLNHIDESGIVLPSSTWKLDFSVFKTISKIIDSGIVESELLEFLEAMKLSGVKCAEIKEILSQFEEYVDEQRCVDPTTEALCAMGGGGIAAKQSSSSASTPGWVAGADAVEDLTLVTLSCADPESRLGNILMTLSRLDNVSHILCWTATKNVLPTMAAKFGSVSERTSEGGLIFPQFKNSFFLLENMDNVKLELVELPRLKISFHEKVEDNGEKKLYSIDHSNLFVSNYRSELLTSLMRGIPHSILLSTVDEEMHILVPIADTVRPRIGSNPFSCELVLDRNNNPDWYAAQDTAYFVYPVHVSLSFLFTPTLSSALYLLLLRFLNRSYEEVMRLANTIGTDTEYSAEENMIFQVLGRSNSDGHPDAHACRLKIAYVLLDSPVPCPWNITRQMSRYITKQGYVSTSCRLTFDEELSLLETCVLSSADPRFYDPETGNPLYSDYEVCIVRNRIAFLRSTIAGRFSAIGEVVPRLKGSSWPLDRNLTALMLPEGEFMNLQVTYAAPGLSSGHAALQVAHKFWRGAENSSGDYAQLGFLYLYELFTGTKKVKVLDTDCSRSFAVLIAELLSDKSETAFLPSILSSMSRFPHLISMMPKFKDNRKFKNTSLAASDPGEDSSGGEIMGPLGSLLAGCMSVLQAEIYNIMMYNHPNATSMFPSPGDETVDIYVPDQASVMTSRTWIVPQISNYSCSSGLLSVIDSISTADCTVGVPQVLELTTADLEAFTSLPLKAIGLHQYIKTVLPSNEHDVVLSDKLPFDVSSHPMAKSSIARSMILRLQTDVADYATAMNTEPFHRMIYLDILLSALNKADETDCLLDNTDWIEALDMLNSLIVELEKLRAVDSTYVENALPWLMERVNSVSTNDSVDDIGDAFARRLFELRRYSGQETHLWLEFLFGTMLSSAQFDDLQKLNPYLTTTLVDILKRVVCAAVLHANRIGQINRCLLDARSVQKSMKKIAHMQRKKHLTKYSVTQLSDVNGPMSSLLHDITLKSDSLVANLTMGRHYVDRVTTDRACSPSGHQGGENKRQRVVCNDEYTFDPRYLLFEFTWNILLRKVQVEMVRDYITDLRRGTSSVKQMIMGAGKTTVVCPLLTLILGDGESLVVQVVPPALLEFSRSIMRSTFSSIMHKRIFTLQFDRSSEVNGNIFTKLLQSRRTRGVVITTPTTVKSIMLKFVETMEILRNANEKLRNSNIHRDCQELGRVLNLFQESILIMDEVDLILHPMKSELNFPIGPKQELDLSPQRWQLPIHLLDAIYFHDLRRMSVPFRSSKRANLIMSQLNAVMQKGYSTRALQKNPHCILLNIDWYHKEMKPVLAEWTHLWLESNHVAGLSKADCCDFLINGASMKSNVALATRIEMSTLTSNHRKLLNLGYDWLESFLPHCLAKIDRVSFGIMNKCDFERAIKMDPFMPRTRSKLAIPFVGKDVPSRSSEFAHPDVILGLTILGYRYEGLRWSDFEDMMANMRSSLIKEEGPWATRKSAMRYARWVRVAGGCIRGDGQGGAIPGLMGDIFNFEGGAIESAESVSALSFNDPSVEKVEVVSLRLLKRSNDNQMKKLYELIYKLPEAIHFYLENFIFPNYMDNKITKLSAAGQDLGGEMMFSRRIGFSGTPSDLLPIELGKCGYEKKSDGQMISVMTDPKVCSFEIIMEGWSPVSVLDMISHALSSPRGSQYHALIDTGALITGLTNLQVAQRLLSGDGLPWCEGVVFLDESDRKMILVRATGRVLKLAQSGIATEKRFAFYDQVHTTGMDIKHTINACAVLTLSKDMVFRDYAQGAYRMRGINKGQKIHIMIIPEVKDLILRELGTNATTCIGANCSSNDLLTEVLKWHSSDPVAVKTVLTAVNAWLIINSMRSERVQFNQLCIQNVSNVWRKSAYSSLLMRHHELTTTSNYGDVDASLRRHLETFCEPIDFSLQESMSDPVHFSESILRRAEAFADLVTTEKQRQVIKEVISWVEASALAAAAEKKLPGGHGHEERDVFLDSEMVQEQEQEQEEEQEREQEQEIEIEKYVDLAYSREHEEPIPWPLSVLSTPLGNPVEPFSPLSKFKLYKRSPIPFPDYVYYSNNYFNPMWNGARRIKNITMVMDWIPDPSEVNSLSTSYEPLDESEISALEKAISLYDVSNSGVVTIAQLNQILSSAVNISFSNSELQQLMASHGIPCPPGLEPDSGMVLPVESLRRLLASGHFSRVQSGRRYVALSLAEAETLRRVLHMRKHAATFRYTATTPGLLLSEAAMLPFLEGFPTTLALRCISDGFRVTDAAFGYFDPSYDPISVFAGAIRPSILSSTFMQDATEQVLRFFNSDMFFSSHNLNVILRAMHGTTRRNRKMFFKHVLSCRRRAAKKWLESSVAKLFTLQDQFAMLKHRAMSFRLISAIRQSGLSLHDAFNKFDFDKNGLLSPGEMWGGFEYLRIELSATDVLDFVSSADTDRDGNISMKELAVTLEDPEKAEKERRRLEQSENDLFFSRSGGALKINAYMPMTLLSVDGNANISSPAAMDVMHDINVSIELEKNETKSDDDNDDDELLPGPPRLQRIDSGGGKSTGSGGMSTDGVVLPKGDDILRELQVRLNREEEEEEANEYAAEAAQELSIQHEIEVEEDENDRLQEGGPNPNILGDMARFDFSTGRLPRRVSTRGDVFYKDDLVLGKYLSVCPLSLMFISIPSSLTATGSAGLCGGNRLNQYTIVLELMLESLPGNGTLYPLFSPSAYAESEAIVWLNSNGQLTDAAGLAFCRRDAGPKIASGKWHVITIVVDCVDCGSRTVFIDGTQCMLGTSSATDSHAQINATSALDGDMSIGEQISLFGSRGKAINSKSSALKCMSLYARSLHQSEIAGLTDMLKSESKVQAVELITDHLQAMGVDYTIAHWAANAAEGDTIEQRINSALNMVYQ